MKRFSIIALALLQFVLVSAQSNLLDESFQSRQSDPGLSSVTTQRASFAELAQFSATAVGEQRVELRWNTAREVQLSHFVVLRSNDGINYEEAGLVFAFGNGNASRGYAFTDKGASLKQGTQYYRLVMVDTNKKAFASEMLTVNPVR